MKMSPRLQNQVAKSNEEALAAFDDHFNYSPDEIDWGHVGTLGYYAELLKQVTGSACCHGATKAPRHASPFNEGEHAE
jgi:hypothetical protein